MKPQVLASSVNDQNLRRSDYFKTALNTNVGDGRNSVEVHECSHRVLSVIIDFMYGIALPEELGVEQLCSLLAMADLYLMEGLKNAVAPLLSKMLELDNILGISRLAEEHTATKLRERCFSFIFANADAMSPQLMDDLAIALPLLGRACLQRYRVQAFANRISHYDLHMDLYKKRAEFSSDLDYGNYVRVNIKSGMIVQYMGGSGGLIPVGTLGQVDSKVDERNAVVVTWQNGKTAVHGLSPNVNEIEIIAAPSY